MADKNSPAPQPQGAQGQQPAINIISQYIKDFSFENPNAPESLVSGWQADTNVEVFMQQQQFPNDMYECTINFRISSKKKGDDSKVCFLVDLSYGALVALKNMPPESHQPLLMVEVPKLLFPFAREIICSATTAAGYPPLRLTPINFDQIYIAHMKQLQQQEQQQGKQAGGAER